MALMNDQKMRESIRGAYPDRLPEAVDQLWYADRAIAADIRFEDFTAALGGGGQIGTEPAFHPQ